MNCVVVNWCVFVCTSVCVHVSLKIYIHRLYFCVCPRIAIFMGTHGQSKDSVASKDVSSGLQCFRGHKDS